MYSLIFNVRTSIQVVPINESRQQSIANQPDFMIPTFNKKPEKNSVRLLYDEEIVLVYVPDYLQLKRKMSLEAFCEYRHLLINLREAPPVSITNILSAKGLQRKIVLFTPYSFSTGEIIKGSDLLCAIPKKLLKFFLCVTS